MIETLKQLLDTEEQSDLPTKMPNSIYTEFARYMQKLRKSVDVNGDDPASRLMRKEIRLLEGMIEQLLRIRLEKAIRYGNTRELLPEEKYVCRYYSEFEKRRDKFLSAVFNGQASFFAIVQRNEMQKMVTLRFLKAFGEIIGFDLKRYGPFSVYDVAHVPSGNAEVLVANGDAVSVQTRDSI